jgi:MraZ protein
VDEKGRLKLPAEFAKFLELLGDKTVFITTTDLRKASVYPTSLWAQMEAFFRQKRSTQEATEANEEMSLLVDHYGADSEIDAQSRVLVPTDLRRELGLESQTVWIKHYKGRFDVVADSVYQEELARAKQNLPQKRALLEHEGMPA